MQSAAQARTASERRRADQGRPRRGLSIRGAREAGVAVTKLFLTMFLWFWLTLLSVVVMLVLISVHVGYSHGPVVRLAVHDLTVFLFAGGIFCYVISSYLTKPLNRLGRAAASIAEGHLDTRVDPKLKSRRDEIAELARNFDR